MGMESLKVHNPSTLLQQIGCIKPLCQWQRYLERLSPQAPLHLSALAGASPKYTTGTALKHALLKQLSNCERSEPSQTAACPRVDETEIAVEITADKAVAENPPKQSAQPASPQTAVSAAAPAPKATMLKVLSGKESLQQSSAAEQPLAAEERKAKPAAKVAFSVAPCVVHQASDEDTSAAPQHEGTEAKVAIASGPALKAALLRQVSTEIDVEEPLLQSDEACQTAQPEAAPAERVQDSKSRVLDGAVALLGMASSIPLPDPAALLGMASSIVLPDHPAPDSPPAREPNL